ncbi:Protein mlp1, partial [Teratosphaeriaceae sp. CCFEE 6253]
GKLVMERDQFLAELGGVRAELEKTKSSLADAEAKLAAQQKDGAEEGEVHEGGDGGDEALRARVLEADTKAAEQLARADGLEGTLVELRTRIEELEVQVTGLQQQLETAQQHLETAQQQHTSPGEQRSEQQQPAVSGVDVAMLEQLRQELDTARSQVESLRANAATIKADTGANTDQPMTNDDQSAAQQVQIAVNQLRAEMESQHQLALTQKDDDCTRKLDAMKQNLKRQLSEGRERQRDEARSELVAQHAAEVQKLREEHEEVLRQMRDAHAAELERLKNDGAKAVEKAEGGAVKAEVEATGAAVELSEAQMMELLKTNERAKLILRNNIAKGIAAQTEGLKKTIVLKEEEIGKLRGEMAGAASQASGNGEGTDESQLAGLQAKLDEAVKAKGATQTRLDEVVKARDVLQTKLNDAIKATSDLQGKVDAAHKDKESAVRHATDVAEKKTKVQLSMRDRYMAQINAVKKAVADTPEQAVKEVWNVAAKAVPPPVKANPPTVVTQSGTAATPLSGSVVQKSTGAPPTPTATQGLHQPAPGAAPQSPAAVAGQTPEQVEAAKLKLRQERFGVQGLPVAASAPSLIGLSSTPSAAGQSTFGKPSAPSGGMFGLPSAPSSTVPSQPAQPNGALGQPARRSSSGQPNPNAATFTPGNVGTGPAALRGLSSGIPRGGGGSGLPRAGGAIGRGSGMSIQGAAQRGGGVPRGPGDAGRARGGVRGGASPRGQKRQHDGEGGGGDGKRTRGGGGA